MSRWRVAGLALGCFVLGIALGRVVAWRLAIDLIGEIAKVAGDYQASFDAIRGVEARRDLEALEALRSGRVGEAISNLEDQLQSHLDALTSNPTSDKELQQLLQEINAYREQNPWAPRLPSDPTSLAGLFASARIIPVYEDGSMVGLRISRIMPGSAWSGMGLRDQDVLVEVDGLPINSPRATVEALKAIEKTTFKAAPIADGRVRLVRSSQ